LAKLGKNAQRILAHLQAHPDRAYGASFGVERGPNGGKGRPFGHQDHAGASALVGAGLAEVVSRDSEIFYRRGYGSHVHHLVIRLKKEIAE
jgi:hypothetical protein